MTLVPFAQGIATLLNRGSGDIEDTGPGQGYEVHGPDSDRMGTCMQQERILCGQIVRVIV